MLNSLIASLGPAVVSQIMARHGANHVAQQLDNGQTTIAPEVAEQVPPASIEAAAAEAEKKDPSIVERVSEFYAGQPALIKTLGGLALTVALARVAQRQSGR